MDIEKVITLVISGVSLALSVYVLWRQRRSEGQAHFTAEWEERDSLIYVNHGPGAAKDVRVRFKTQVRPVDDTIGYIGAYQVMRIAGIVRVLGETPTEQLELSWRDNRRKRQSATIFLPEPPTSQTSTRAVPTSSRDGLEASVRQLARDEAQREIADQVRTARRRRPGRY